MSYRQFFGAVVVLLLLVLYVLITKSAIALLDCTPSPECLAPFSETKQAALAAISGLVSAVVIAELAIAKPGTEPFGRFLADEPKDWAKRLFQIVTFAYIATWLGIGIWVLVATWDVSDSIPALTTIGRSWLGLLVAAGYAYFGVKEA